MSLEIERKFLVSSDAWQVDAGPGRALKQTYLATTDKASVRVRIVDGDEAWLTIKSSDTGLIRSEFEYAIPIAQAMELLPLGQGTPIEKVRYPVQVGDVAWDVDVFEGANAGLVLAEIELADEHQRLELPVWVGEEVTGKSQYYNSNLTYQPVSEWPETQ